MPGTSTTYDNTMSDNDAAEFDKMLRGPANLTGAINTANYIAQFVIQPDGNWPARGFDAENVFYQSNGGDVTSLKPQATLAELTTDGAQTDSTVAVESPTIVYRPGTEVTASAGLFVDVLPTGDSKYEIMYGREPRTIVDPYDGSETDVGVEYAGLRITDGSGDRDVGVEFVVGSDRDGDGEPTEIVVPITGGDWKDGDFVGEFDEHSNGGAKARVYGIDPLDGSGRSGLDFDPRTGYVFGFEIGWYGPTALVPYIVETTGVAGAWKQRRHPVLIYEPVEGPSIQRPNQPIRVVADNGTTGQDLKARLGGRAGAYRGDLNLKRTPDVHQTRNQTIASTGGTTGTEGLNWYVVAVVKSRATDPDVIIAPETPTFSGDNQGSTMVRIADESSISGTIEYDEPSNTHRSDVSFAIDAKSDTPDRLSLDTSTIDGEEKFDGEKVGAGFIQSGALNEAGLTELRNIFGFTIPRDKVFVLLAAARGNSDVALDTTLGFTTSG